MEAMRLEMEADSSKSVRWMRERLGRPHGSALGEGRCDARNEPAEGISGDQNSGVG